MAENENYDSFESSDRSSNVGIALTLLFIGLGVGALTALLLAPKTGKQIRRTLRRRYEDAREVLDDWSDQASDVFEKGADMAGKARDRVAPIADRFRR